MIDVCLVHFRTLHLPHFEAAWYSLAQQDFTDVGHVIVLDNNTAHARVVLQHLAAKHPVPVPVVWCLDKHGIDTRTQSYSVNRAVRLALSDWVFFTRTDFLLDRDCLRRFRLERDRREPSWRGFVTSWCYQMGCDRELSNRDVIAGHSLAGAPWRSHPDGLQSLVGVEPGVPFQSADEDAGVWLGRASDHARAGGLNEKMTSWGYQQQAYQRALRRTGVEIVQIPQYLFFHQHHAAPRDFDKAAEELRHEGT